MTSARMMTGGDDGETFTWLLFWLSNDTSLNSQVSVTDLSEVMEHVSWTMSHTALYLLYQLVKVFNPGGATPSVRINSSGTQTGCRSLRLSNHWAGLPSMADILIEKNLRLLSHVHRMNNNRLPKKLLYFQLCLAMRNQ